MAMFTLNELAYLREQRIGRLATLTADGQPHVVPTIFSVDADGGAIEIGARDLPDRGQQRQYARNIAADPRVAFVVDDVQAAERWTPRGVTIRGRAEIYSQGGERLGDGYGPKWVRVVPAFVSSWGIDTASYDRPVSRHG